MILETASRFALILALAALASGCDLDGLDSSGDNNVTPSDWEDCPERLGGTWAFGRAPFGCTVDEVGSAETVRTDFADYIFDDAVQRTSERDRYMNALYEFLLEEAADYLRDRKPDVTDEEVGAWQRAVFATAHQESFWTHYRKGDADAERLLTMIRGDMGHGHGLMQIDDRWHTDAIAAGVGWRLDENFLYALDIYFSEWERALSTDCVDAPNAWESRARSAYSAYNGGPTQLCRWTDPDHRWAQNDEGFYDKYSFQRWLNHVSE